MTENSGRFGFDGDGIGYVRTRLGALAITVLTLGFGVPYALVLVKRWNAQHLVLGGSRVVFTGRAGDLMPDWVRWWPCVVLTLGCYGFVVFPRVISWVWENTDYRALWTAEADPEPEYVRPLVAPVRAHLAFFAEPGLPHPLP